MFFALASGKLKWPAVIDVEGRSVLAREIALGEKSRWSRIGKPHLNADLYLWPISEPSGQHWSETRADKSTVFFWGWFYDENRGDITTSIPDSYGADFIQRLKHSPGNWILLEATSSTVEIFRSEESSIPLYFCQDDGYVVISNRIDTPVRLGLQLRANASLLADLANYGVPYTYETLFEKIYAVPAGSSVAIANGSFSLRPGASFFKPELLELSQSNPKTHWDEAYGRLSSMVSGVVGSFPSPHLSLSGGKDSRLIMSLVSKRQSNAIKYFSWDNPDERRIANLLVGEVGAQLGCRHRGRSSKVPRGRAEELLDHAVSTEGEMSPKDLSPYLNTERSPWTLLDGQESGLRDIAVARSPETWDDVYKWFRIHLGNFNFTGLLTSEAQEMSEERFFSNMPVIPDGLSPGFLPSLHRAEFRGARWVSRVFSGQNFTNTMAVHPLRTSLAMSYASSLSLESRRSETFHRELLARFWATDLGALPFYMQAWPGATTRGNDSEQVRTPKKEVRNATGGTGVSPKFEREFDSIVRLIIRGVDEFGLGQILDTRALREFRLEGLRAGHEEKVWAVFGGILFLYAQEFGKSRSLEILRSVGFA